MANKTTKNPNGKHWAGCTINNWNETDLQCFEQNKDILQYFVYGKEIGEEGTPHLQFMLCLKAKKKLSALSKLFPRAHLELKSRFSTMKQASDYCKKDGNFVEWGTLPLDQQTSGLKIIADRYADTLEKAKLGLIDEIEPEMQIRYYNTIKQIAHDNKPMPADLTWKEGEQPNVWIWGPTRTGKSWRARQICGQDMYIKNAANKWWDRYDGQKNVLIEDIDKTHSYQGYYLKIWADKYAFPAEIKKSGDLVRPEIIVVTSNYKIEDVFTDPSIHLPLLERFKVIHMGTKWDDTVNTVLHHKDLPIRSKKRRALTEGERPFKKPALYRQNANGDLVINTTKQQKIDEIVDLTQSLVLDLVSESDCSQEDFKPPTSQEDEDSSNQFPWGDCDHCHAKDVEVVNGLCNICEELIAELDEYNNSNDEDDINIIEDF